jgi:stage II sporulation protein AB (anti-sigma F factor)
MKISNEMKLQIESKSVNESFARATVAAFASQLDPNIEEISDIKTAVSEAVTNCIVHAYPETVGIIYINARITDEGSIIIKIRDRGCGIQNIKQAMEPLFTTLGGERAGLGFAVMESFCDKVRVTSKIGKGTTVTLVKNLKGRDGENE